MNRLTKKTEKQNDLLFSHELNLTDDNEYENLKKIADEIFGNQNYLVTFHIQVRYTNKTLNEKNAEQLEKKLRENKLDLNDMLMQFEEMKKMMVSFAGGMM